MVNLNPDSVHPMVIRFCIGTNRPTEHLDLHVSSVSLLPKSYRDVFNDPNWQNAMRDEHTGLIKNKTWILVPRPSDTNIVRSASRHWPIHQLDVKNAFLHGDLSEIVYMHQPLGFWDSAHPDYGIDTAYLLLYVDDIVLAASFEGLFLSQKKYVIEILEKAHMVSCNPSQTSVDAESKLGDDGDPQVCLHMHDPRESHLSALKMLLRYVQGTLNYGLQLFSSSTTYLVAYSDTDWAGCPITQRLTSEYSAKRQPMLSRSNVEAKYRGVANAVAETCWLRNLLRELHTPISSATLVYCDNVSAVYLSSNLVQHQRTKHIEIDIHFVRDLVVARQVRVLHVPSRYQFADIFTNGYLQHYLKSFDPI
ncbi:ribonuclease H-like domain-containing protein [Tanacetum coccineum]